MFHSHAFRIKADFDQFYDALLTANLPLNMLFAHQEGSVKVGQVVRYTLTYTPSLDQRPCPALYLRIKNTSAIPYRAAYLVGPYTVHVSAYPSTFNPYKKLENPHRDGVPQFEPNLKAGGHWHATLNIPEDIRQQAPKDSQPLPSYTWIVEISSQILFSNVASVHFELLLARDERSLDTGFAALASRGHGEPGKIRDLVPYADDGPGPHPTPKGVYSRAIHLIAEDTAQLWHKPALPRIRPTQSPVKPQPDPEGDTNARPDEKPAEQDANNAKPRKKVHLVVLTHGLHSNVGADMLYMKESIDATVKQAREERQKRKAAEKRKASKQNETEKPGDRSDKGQESSTAPLSGGQEDLSSEQEDDPDDEQVIVRGFSGNVVRTEKGIQYLGKRLAKYILTLTFPDQPFLPQAKSMTRSFSLSFPNSRKGSLANESNIHKFNPEEVRPYQFTSISFIGHSLGGLIQLYAIGYIQKHSPEFFDRIKPINFISMAAPLLGLSNENPMYVKFALDFGLVGRTGQDLGLTWRPPTIARSGWNAMFSGFGGGGDKEEQPKQEDPRSKPLLRILPSGPAHHVLRRFRNRTVYSNIVNDGIVPLRTSCLLFLDWRGLERVDNARRENGLLGTLAQFGWAELTGANTISHKPESRSGISFDSTNVEGDKEEDQTPPSPHDQRKDFAEGSMKSPISPAADQFLGPMPDSPHSGPSSSEPASARNSLERPQTPASPFDRFLDFIRPKPAAEPKPRKISKSSVKPYQRAQTIKKNPEVDGDKSEEQVHDEIEEQKKRRPLVTRGSSLMSHDSSASTPAPPKTSIFEAAGDIINPPIPTLSWLTDPSSRSRTIFHDRIYYPEDIPSPPSKKRHSKLAKASNESLKDQPPSTPTTPKSPIFSPGGRTRSERELGPEVDSSGMKVEEKIARAYHRDLSWRKVLVRLEPDAHNNMIVRRMFANAYGWDVIRHLCDTHFADTYSARTGDEEEDGRDRAKPAGQMVGEYGEMVTGQRDKEQPETGDGAGEQHPRSKTNVHDRTLSELNEVDDLVPELGARPGPATSKRLGHRDSMTWSDDIFEGTDEEWESNEE